MAPKGRGGKGGRGGRGKQTPGRQNNPAVRRREFPRDVIFAILTRLPVKSVVRFTCASKSWRTLVSLPAFAAAHLSRSPPALLIHGENAQVPGHIAYAFRPPNPESGQPIAAIHRLNFPGSGGVVAELNVVIGAAPNGVVCIIHDRLAQNFTLWNPATGSSLRIPAPKSPDPDAILGTSAGIGYNPASKEYSIIRIVRYHRELKQPDVAFLFNFHNGRWDNLGKVNFRAEEVKCDAVVNGVPYWRAWEHEELLGSVLKLAWFDVRSSIFRTEWFGWVRPEKKELHLSEIRAGLLGAIVWAGRAEEEEEDLEERVLEVWTRSTTGLWTQTYRVDPQRLPCLGRVVGFFREEELVQEIILGPDENWKPALCIIKLGGDVGVRGYCNLVGIRLSTCTVTRYRESLTRLPKIGSAMI